MLVISSLSMGCRNIYYHYLLQDSLKVFMWKCSAFFFVVSAIEAIEAK